MRTDFLLGADGDLVIKDGDLLTGQSDDQNIQLILLASKGTWKQYPLLGAGIRKELNGTIDESTKRIIRLNLQSDGYKARTIKTNTEILDIDYESDNS